LKAIGKVLSGLENSANMFHAKVYKAVKPYMSHSSVDVRYSAADCLSQLAKFYPALVVQSEFESLFSLAAKYMSAEGRTKSFSILIANLALSALSNSVKLPPENKKERKPTLQEILGYFRQSFITGACVQKREIFKQDISPSIVKLGIADAHVFLVRGLGSSWLEANSTLFLGHILGIAMEPRTTQSHQEALYTCRQLRRIFFETVGQLLSEKAQLQALKVLGQFICDHCASSDIQSGYALSLACQAITSITLILQSSSLPSLSDGYVANGLQSTLCHELPMARLSAAWCLRQIALSQPSMHWSIFTTLVSRLCKFKSNRVAVEGHTCALVANLSSIGLCRHTVIESCHINPILENAQDLLKSKSTDAATARSKFLGAWILFCGVLSVPSVGESTNEIVSTILSQASASFPSGDVKGAFLKEQKLESADQVRLIVESRSGALKALKVFVEQHPELVCRHSETIVRILRAALEYLSHTAKVVSTFGQPLLSIIHYYKMVLYSTLSASPRELWEHSLSDLLKHLVSDITLAESNELFTTSLLDSLVDVQDLELLSEGNIVQTCNMPLGCLQHSASSIITKSVEMPEPLPLQNQLLDEACTLFGQAFPLSAIKHRAQIANHFIQCLRQVRKDRRVFIQVNILAAFSLALKECSRLKGTVGDEQVIKSTAELMVSFVSHPSPIVKCVASSGLGRLAQLNPNLINSLAQISFEKIKDPKSSEATKSGFCLVLGDLHRFVGTGAKTSHIRTTCSILLSIANDARLGQVQTWATFALFLVVDAVGPNYTSFVEPTIDCVLDQLLAASSSMQNVKCLSKLLQALITVIGPELSADEESIRTIRACIAVLESTTAVQEAISCAQCLQMFVPREGNLSRILPRLCEYLDTSLDTQLQSVAVGCIRQLSQRNPRDVSIICEGIYPNGIESKLFDLFEIPDGIALNQVRDTLNLLLSARIQEKTDFWIAVVREVFQASHAAVNESAISAGDDSEEEDDEEKMTMNDGEKKEKPHWRTRVFAAEILSNIMEHCVDSGHAAHFDLDLCRQEKGDRSQFLVTHLSDLIRCFFIAATDSNTQLVIAGLTSLERLIDLFKNSMDPDVAGSFLLEQYQANISAALRPAFSSDALPLVSVKASSVAAKWLSSDVASSTNDIQRVYRLMVSSLDSIRYPRLESHASPKMCQLKDEACIVSWADIYIAAFEQACGGVRFRSERELPPDGMLNLVSVELTDLKKIWISFLAKSDNQRICNSIAHAVAILTKLDEYWNENERDIVVQLITGISIETLLAPASSISAEDALHAISSLSKINFDKLSSNIEILQDILRVAHRVIITRNDQRMSERALEISAKMVSTVQLNENLRQFSLETIICALEKSCSDASLSLITSSLKKLVEDGKCDNLVLSYALSSLLTLSVTRRHSSSLVSTIVAILGVVKLFDEDIVHSIIVHYCELPIQKHFASLSNTVAAFFIANYHKQLSTFHLKALCKVFVHGLGKQESQAQTVLLIQTCLKKGDERMQKVLMNDVGTHVSRLIWENLMSPTDTLEALNIFAQFAESTERGQIVYIRLLFNMLQKDLKTVEVLHLFSHASATYSQTVKRVLASDNQFKLIVEKSLRIQQNAHSSLSEHRDGGQNQPKIELKMNFSNYS